MKRVWWGIAIFIAFFVGCGASSVVQQLIVPPARADTNPIRWEYHCVKAFHMEAEELTTLFNQFGAPEFRPQCAFKYWI